MRFQRIALTLFALSTTTASISFPANSVAQLRTSQVFAQTTDTRKTEAQQLLHKGREQLMSHQLEAAKQSLQQALFIYRELKDRSSEGQVLNDLGILYKEFKEYGKAIEYYQQSLAIAKESKSRSVEGAALENLGTVYKEMEDLTNAISYYRQALVLAQELKYRKTEAELQQDLAAAYNSLENRSQAIEYYQRSLEIAREIKSPSLEFNALENLGSIYEVVEDPAKMIEIYQQILRFARAQPKDFAVGFDIEGDALAQIANGYLSLGNYPKFIDSAQQSLVYVRERQNQSAEAHILIALGNAYQILGDYDRAIDLYQQSVTIARKTVDRDGEGKALHNLGSALRDKGNLVEAEKVLQTAIQVWESIREKPVPDVFFANADSPEKKSLWKSIDEIGRTDAAQVQTFEGQVPTYSLLQKVLIMQKKFDRALEVAEQGRARAFVKLLAKQLPTAQSQQSALIPPTIEQIKKIASTQKATIVEYSIIHDFFQVDGTPQIHESELYTWVIKPTGEITFRQTDLKPLWQQQKTSLADLVFTSRDSIGVRGLPIIGIVPRSGFQQRQETSLTEQLQQLHKLLIEPITDFLPTDPNAHVVFIPQESLFLVPFPALKDKEGKYLIEKHTILTAPSIQVLKLTHEQRQQVEVRHVVPLQGDDALVVGNPTMPSVRAAPDQPPQPLPSLPGAETEANAIAPLLNTKPLIGNEATKSTVKQLMSKARIIHLATHGLLDDVRGLGSAIALAPDSSYKEKVGKVNGLLTAEEILDLKLNAELVVLSACNTGRGKITGDGVIGLSRSLISAGVPSVLVSLWSVPDAPTAQLMTEFYQNLQKNPDKAQALRQAMLTILKNNRNTPKNWAAFTLIGESN